MGCFVFLLINVAYSTVSCDMVTARPLTVGPSALLLTISKSWHMAELCLSVCCPGTLSQMPPLGPRAIIQAALFWSLLQIPPFLASYWFLFALFAWYLLIPFYGRDVVSKCVVSVVPVLKCPFELKCRPNFIRVLYDICYNSKWNLLICVKFDRSIGHNRINVFVICHPNQRRSEINILWPFVGWPLCA